MATKNWDVRQVNLIIAAIIVDAGFGEGTFVKMTRAQRAFTAKEGCDGEVTRSKTNSRLATFVVTLGQLSSANTKLAALHELDKRAAGGAGIGPFLLQDKNGTAIHAGQCWIAKAPDAEFGKEAGDLEWEIDVDLDESFQGGA